MSLPGSNRPQSRQPEGDTTLVTAMVAVAAAFLIAGTIALSIPLKNWYGKFFWEVGSTSKDK